MSVVLLRLEGLMQSWGIESRFTDRHTEAEPSKSGVIGLISSALGRSREEKIEDLVQLKMAIRVDREGEILYDYHTTLDVLRAEAKGKITSSKLETVLSRRFYISDACFLVGLEKNDDALLRDIIHSLKNPNWPLFLGRKSYPSSSPICMTDEVIKTPLLQVIKTYPWQGRPTDQPPEFLRLIYECAPGEGEPRLDVPISFRPRTYRSRYVLTEFIPFKSLLQEG
jgi:CRISPR system Cascade subunit CasD